MRVSATAIVDPGDPFEITPGPELIAHFVHMGSSNELHMAFKDAADLRRLRDTIDAALDPHTVRLDPDRPEDCDALVQAVHAETGKPALDVDQAAAVLRAIARVRTS